MVAPLEAHHARLVADLGELLDAGGRTTSAPAVRTADWNVRLTCSGGLLVALFGAVWTLIGVRYVV